MDKELGGDDHQQTTEEGAQEPKHRLTPEGDGPPRSPIPFHLDDRESSSPEAILSSRQDPDDCSESSLPTLVPIVDFGSSSPSAAWSDEEYSDSDGKSYCPSDSVEENFTTASSQSAGRSQGEMNDSQEPKRAGEANELNSASSDSKENHRDSGLQAKDMVNLSTIVKLAPETEDEMHIASSTLEGEKPLREECDIDSALLDPNSAERDPSDSTSSSYSPSWDSEVDVSSSSPREDKGCILHICGSTEKLNLGKSQPADPVVNPNDAVDLPQDMVTLPGQDVRGRTLRRGRSGSEGCGRTSPSRRGLSVRRKMVSLSSRREGRKRPSEDHESAEQASEPSTEQASETSTEQGSTQSCENRHAPPSSKKTRSSPGGRKGRQ